MANKKVSQLVAKPSVLVTDLFPIADPTTGQLYKTTISDLGTAIGSGVSSVNTLVGAVVLDTDDIQELASPTNRWFTDTRARAALSASSPLAYNSGTGVFSIPAATSSQNGYLTSTDWATFNAKQAALSGTGFVKISGTTISYDNSTYLTTSAAASTYLALAGGTLTGALNGTSANFSGDLTLTGTNPRFYLTDSDNNPDYFISNTDGTFTVYDVTNSTSRFTIGTTGNGTFGGNLTVGQIIRSGGTSAQFLKADGSIDSSTYALDSDVVKLTGNQTINGVKTFDAAVIINSSLNIVSGFYSIINNPGNTAYWQTYVDSSNLFIFGYQGTTPKVTINSSGNLTANSFIKSSGTSSQFLKADGSVDSTAYLPLGGGTLTGALNGTSAVFSSSVTTSGVYLTGMTSGSGALYYSSGSNRVTLANYNTNGIVLFEVNGGAAALTLNANLSATFAGAISGTSASFSGSITANNEIIVNASANTIAPQFVMSQTGGNTYSAIGINRANGTGIATGLGSALVLRSGDASDAPIQFATANNVRMTIGTTGNVGIGTTAPTNKLEVIGDVRISIGSGFDSYYGYGSNLDNYYSTGDLGTHIWRTGNTERMRITSGGELLIGTTSDAGDYKLQVAGNAYFDRSVYIANTAPATPALYVDQAGNNNDVVRVNMTNASKHALRVLWYGGAIGGIQVNGGGTGLNYETTSDYRLKEDLKTIKGLEIVNKIKVYDYKWKSHDSRMDGVLAHELAEVLPYAVSGVKDGEQMQGVDYSKIVPVMVQAIKELKAKIETLENK